MPDVKSAIKRLEELQDLYRVAVTVPMVFVEQLLELLKEYEVLKDQNAKLIRQKQERFQPVRCKDCCNWKPPHILLNDGRQRLYRDGEKNDPLHIGVSMDVGINIGGKCWVDHNCGYGRDMRVFRKENDYCSRATKLPEGTTAEQYWGLSEEPAELLDD